MQESSKYPSKSMLKYIEKRCKQLGEERDFIQYLLSMKHAESIERLINIYNNIFKLLAFLCYGTLKFPYNWYQAETWGRNVSWVEELNCYLNENILNWIESQENITRDQCIMSLSNLRESENVKDIYNKIMDYSKLKGDTSVSSLLPTIIEQFSARKKIERKNNHEEALKEIYISCSKYLAYIGRIFDVAEIAFGEANGITYENMADEYKIDLVKERAVQIAKDEKKRKIENNTEAFFKSLDGVGSLLGSALLNLSFGFLGAIFSNVNRKK